MGIGFIRFKGLLSCLIYVVEAMGRAVIMKSSAKTSSTLIAPIGVHGGAV